MEAITTFTALGIRCWDPVVDSQVADALSVTASPVNQPLKKIHAIRTPGGVYAFPRLPGMLDIENAYRDGVPTGSPEATYGFVIEIHDSRRRYLSIAVYIELPLPYAGVFLSNGAANSISSSPPVDAPHIDIPHIDIPRGLHLYSAITRNMSSSMAVIRGELLQESTRLPAAFALLMVQAESGETWYGITDASGYFNLIFPYPALQEGFAGSPADASPGDLSAQSWLLEFTVFYSPASQQSLPGTELPNYLSILHQPAAEIWPQDPAEGGSALNQLPVSLVYHQPAVTKTDGLSQLLISPLP